MKYIKLFENVDLEEIKEFSTNCLVDLIDKDFKVEVIKLTGYYMIKLIKEDDAHITWEEIKDEFQFFVEILLNDYQLVGRAPFCILGKALTNDEYIEIGNNTPKYGYGSFKYAAVFVAKK